VAKGLGKRKPYLKMKNRNIDVNGSKAILRGWLFLCFVRRPKVSEILLNVFLLKIQKLAKK
jgi:hypothetical protein